jgi:hypothetical protein
MNADDLNLNPALLRASFKYIEDDAQLFADLYAWHYGVDPDTLYGSTEAADLLRNWMPNLLRNF